MPLHFYIYQKSEKKSSPGIQFWFGLATGFFIFIILLVSSILFQPPQQSFASPIPIGYQQPLISSSLTPTTIPTTIPITIPLASPTINFPTFTQPSRSSYSIAVFGDSMVDTMGERLEYLEHALKKIYPSTSFTLYNFGKGSENVEMGLNRFVSELHYQDRNYPLLAQIQPDIIIIGSFAYNPFTPHDRDKHWLKLTELIKSAQSISPSVYMLAEIAPLRKDFGKGPNGVNWDEQTNYEHSGRIIEQLENAVNLAKDLNIGLIDAFTPTHNSAKEGERKYVNPGDGIHPSAAGHEFMADLIAKTLKF